MGRAVATAAARLSVVVVVVHALLGCTHTVQITSNVPDAEVRVDGVPLGLVKDGATFDEEWGFGRVYDIEVRAPRHRLERRQVKPNVVDAVVGIPAMFVALSGCGLSACGVPIVALITATSADTPGTQALGYGSSAAILGCTAVSTSVVAFGSQRLPDTIHVELAPELGVGDEGLPPPPTTNGVPPPPPPPPPPAAVVPLPKAKPPLPALAPPPPTTAPLPSVPTKTP